MFADADPVAEGRDRRRIEDDLALLGECSASARSSISRPASTSMSWMSGSPTTNRRAGPTATATFIASWTVVPPGVWIVPSRAIASCIATAAAVARMPSSPSIQQVMASPEK